MSHDIKNLIGLLYALMGHLEEGEDYQSHSKGKLHALDSLRV